MTMNSTHSSNLRIHKKSAVLQQQQKKIIYLSHSQTQLKLKNAYLLNMIMWIVSNEEAGSNFYMWGDFILE